MNRLPTKFHPTFLPKPRTLIPHAIRNRLGSLLMGPPRGTRTRHKQACVMALGRIGDFVLSVSAFRLFAREFGPDQLTLLVSPTAAPLAQLELPGVELITLKPEAGSLFREMVPIWWRNRPNFARAGFERRVTLNHFRPFYHEIVFSWVDAKQECRLTSETYPAAMRDGQCRELQAHQLVASQALGRPVAWEEILPAFTRFAARNDGRLLVYPLSHDGLKDIPVGQIVAILQLWRARSRAPVVFGGNPHDRPKLERYLTAAEAAGLGGFTLEAPAGVVGFIEHLAAAGAVLTTESAAGHVGGAFDKPCIVLAPQRWYGLSQPWSRSARQRAFLFDASNADIAAALPAL
jgi:ADP-heptose:LPS heptosyltransferase